MPGHPTPTGLARTVPADRIVVSKTDPKGVITYANRTFIEISGYSEAELLGKPHNIVRHPAMPRCIFRLVWTELQAGREAFAYINNLCKNGDNYWVFAHISPDQDPTFGTIAGYHSSRRQPTGQALATIEPLYAALLEEEARHDGKIASAEAGLALLDRRLAEAGMGYGEFVFSLT